MFQCDPRNTLAALARLALNVSAQSGTSSEAWASHSMSLKYLQQILPLPPGDATSDGQAEDGIPIKHLTEHELGAVLARFEQFKQAVRCQKDKIEPIDQYLQSFNREIEQLSESLHALQLKSTLLSAGLDKHRELVETVNPAILDLAIPPLMAQSILLDPVNEAWVENLAALVEKQQLCENISAGKSKLPYKDWAAFKELESGLDVLESKAIERIRNHIIAQIRQLRSSVKSLSQAVQKQLLSVKDIYTYLKRRHPELANQLQLAYIYTMKWYYTTRFAKYLYSLQKLRLKSIDLLYVLGSSNESHEQTKLSLFGFVEAGYAATQSVTGSNSPGIGGIINRVSLSEYLLSASKRISSLSRNSEESTAIPSQIAETTPFTYWLEFPFSQFSNALLDNIIVEYLFVTDFFYDGNEKFDAISELDPSVESNQDWSQVMFEGVFKIGQSFANWLVTASQQTLGSRITSGAGVTQAYGSGVAATGSTSDCYAILLMIRMVQDHLSLLHNQFHVPVMDDYHNSLLLMLWPHFTKIVDINCESLKKRVSSKVSFFGSASANQAPIFVTQQFAQLMVGLLQLAYLSGDDQRKEPVVLGEPIVMSILRLRNDYESSITKAGTQLFGSSKSKAVQKEMFMFNNYFLVTTILKNEFESLQVVFIEEQVKHFELLCDAYRPR